MVPNVTLAALACSDVKVIVPATAEENIPAATPIDKK
jgi:hypothetical protein